MRRIEIKQLDYDLTPVAGLALVSHYLKALAPQWAGLDAALPVRSGVISSDIVRSYLGLLVQGKSDFDAIEGYRGDKFFKDALGIGLLPSSPTLRQRLDAQAGALFEHVPAMIEQLLRSQRPDYGLLACGWLPLDVDTFAMDNSGTAKEGVGRTYAGVDGYCPLAAYLGAHGFCLELALRPGVQHSAKEPTSTWSGWCRSHSASPLPVRGRRSWRAWTRASTRLRSCEASKTATKARSLRSTG